MPSWNQHWVVDARQMRYLLTVRKQKWSCSVVGDFIVSRTVMYCWLTVNLRYAKYPGYFPHNLHISWLFFGPVYLFPKFHENPPVTFWVLYHISPLGDPQGVISQWKMGPIISLEWVKLGTWNLVSGLMLMSSSTYTMDYPWRWCVRVTWLL